ncbi:MAG: hypothetical protein ABEH81_12135 [Halopenitus sp.]
MNSGGMGGSLVGFEIDESELTIHDELEDRTQRILVDSPIDPDPALAELFHVPIDAAVSFSAETFTIASCGGVLLRDEVGEVVTQPTDETVTAPRGTYYLEVTVPIKCYLRLPDVEVSVGHTGEPFDSPVRVTLGGERTVTAGARSLHSRPEATITVPDDPVARMEAMSYLGSSIKEFSPERSWPTLRGYPPRIERGSELDVPSSLTKPNTGITVTVPENHADIYRVAPLAFYLGATVESGKEPTLHLPNGYTEPLVTSDRSLEESVERIVAKCLLLDSLARQEGYTPITVRSYADVGPHLSFYPEAIADDPLADQLLEYLEAPDAPVFDALPHWPAAAVLRPDPADVSLLPHLLDSMALISVAGDASTRPPSTAREGPSSPIAIGYSHDEVPAGSVALADAAFERKLTGEAVVREEAVVAVVTDDPDRAERLSAGLESAPLADIPARIDVRQSPTSADLRSVLTTEADLLLLDLPVSVESPPIDGDAAGPVVDCADGALDLSTLQTFGPRAVLVEGDRAPSTAVRKFVAGDDGVAAGGDGGSVIALVAEGVAEPDLALSVLGCLLCAWSVAGTARLHFDPGDYRLAGVPDATAVSRSSGMEAELFIADQVGPDEFSLRYVVSPMGASGVGSVAQNVEEFSHDEYQLLGTVTRMPATVSAERVQEILADDEVVVIVNGKLDANVVPHSAEFVRRSAQTAPEPDTRSPDKWRGTPADRRDDWIVK